jgi:hypothetical protein
LSVSAASAIHLRTADVKLVHKLHGD